MCGTVCISTYSTDMGQYVSVLTLLTHVHVTDAHAGMYSADGKVSALHLLRTGAPRHVSAHAV